LWCAAGAAVCPEAAESGYTIAQYRFHQIREIISIIEILLRSAGITPE